MAKLLIHRLRWTSSAARRRWSGARRRSGTRMTWRLCWTRRRSSRVGTEFSICSVVFDVHLQALLDAAEEQHALKLAIAVQTAISSAGGAGTCALLLVLEM